MSVSLQFSALYNSSCMDRAADRDYRDVVTKTERARKIIMDRSTDINITKPMAQHKY